MIWGMNEVSDMCEPESEDYRRVETDLKYFDETTWEEHLGR